MQNSETLKVLREILATYPNFNPSSIAETAIVWTRIFADVPGGLVQTAVEAYIADDTSGFAPTPGQVNEYLQRITKPEDSLSDAEAWALYFRTACSCNQQNAEEKFSKLPAAVRKAAGSYQTMLQMAFNQDFNEGVESSNFKRAYRVAVERETAEARLPESAKRVLEAFGHKALEGRQG